VLQCIAVCCSALQCVAVHCSALQCVAVRCSALQCIAARCNLLQCAAVRCSALQRVAVCSVRCSVLQCVAVCCSVLQCVAVCCSVLQFVAMTRALFFQRRVSALQSHHVFLNEQHSIAIFYRLNDLHCVAVCCSVLQFIAVYCSVLQCVAVCDTTRALFFQEKFSALHSLYTIFRFVNARGHVEIWYFAKAQWTLQHTATHCNTLQHTATHCNTLQHTAASNAPWQNTKFLRSQTSFRKRATNYRAVLRRMNYTDKASHASLPTIRHHAQF